MRNGLRSRWIRETVGRRALWKGKAGNASRSPQLPQFWGPVRVAPPLEPGLRILVDACRGLTVECSVSRGKCHRRTLIGSEISLVRQKWIIAINVCIRLSPVCETAC